MNYHYVWFIWSTAFLIPWAALYLLFPAHRRPMLMTSVFTAPFGLTEPLFVPEYWNPPSLFDLAQKTGFDIESLIFTFGIGGVGAVFYNVLTGRRLQRVEAAERRHHRHRLHLAALLVPVVAFPLLYLLPWNAIYPGVLAMLAGAISAVLCRPDLKLKTLVGGCIFLGYYLLFMLALKWLAPGYIESVWNLDALTGISIYGVPLEELLFGFAFGAYWAGVYEHVTWRRPVAETLPRGEYVERAGKARV